MYATFEGIIGPYPRIKLAQRTVGHALPHLGKRIIIIGAGLAGISTAVALTQRGYQVSVVEQHSNVAMGALVTRKGLFTPNFQHTKRLHTISCTSVSVCPSVVKKAS